MTIIEVPVLRYQSSVLIQVSDMNSSQMYIYNLYIYTCIYIAISVNKRSHGITPSDEKSKRRDLLHIC